MKQEHKFYGLDHLRALAITLVFLFHYDAWIFAHPKWLDDVAKFGWTGVDLFFVLSGFLISSQLFAQVQQTGSIRVKDFFIKRFLRILPAFWVVLAIYFSVPFFHEREQLAPWWKYAFFVHNLNLDVARFGTFSHVWSLCVEEHFYLLLPFTLLLLLARRLFRHGYWLLLLLFVGTMCMRYYAFHDIYLPATATDSAGLVWYRTIYYPTWCRLDGLVIGVGIAALYTFMPAAWARIARWGHWLVLAGLLALTGAYFLCYDERSFQGTVYGFAVVAIGYGLLVMAALSPRCLLFRWSSRITSFIASLSYGIYLVHKGIIHVTQAWLADIGIDTAGNLSMAACITACVLAALLLHVLVERPFMRWRKTLIKPGLQAQVVPVPVK